MVRMEEELDSLSAPPGIPSPALLQPSAFHLLCSLPPFQAAWAPVQGAQRVNANQDRCYSRSPAQLICLAPGHIQSPRAANRHVPAVRGLSPAGAGAELPPAHQA